MPLEFIASHLPRVRKIVVLASADAPGKEDGTIRKLAVFEKLVRHLLPELPAPEHREVLNAGAGDRC